MKPTSPRPLQQAGRKVRSCRTAGIAETVREKLGCTVEPRPELCGVRGSGPLAETGGGGERKAAVLRRAGGGGSRGSVLAALLEPELRARLQKKVLRRQPHCLTFSIWRTVIPHGAALRMESGGAEALRTEPRTEEELCDFLSSSAFPNCLFL